MDSCCRGKIECSPPRIRCCYSRERLARVRRPPSRGKEVKKSRTLPQIHRVSLGRKASDAQPPLVGCHRVKKGSINFPDVLRGSICSSPRLILEVRILKSFKSCVFGSADSERDMSVFFGSADCRGVSGERTGVPHVWARRLPVRGGNIGIHS